MWGSVQLQVHIFLLMGTGMNPLGEKYCVTCSTKFEHTKMSSRGERHVKYGAPCAVHDFMNYVMWHEQQFRESSVCGMSSDYRTTLISPRIISFLTLRGDCGKLK